MPLPHQLKSILCVLKLESVCDQWPHVDFTTSDQINGSWIAARRVANRATDSQITNARDGDWKFYNLLLS